jgi:hypothetical protein
MPELHWCETCGAPAVWGAGVALLRGRPGRWWCSTHKADWERWGCEQAGAAVPRVVPGRYIVPHQPPLVPVGGSAPADDAAQGAHTPEVPKDKRSKTNITDGAYTNSAGLSQQTLAIL